MHTLICIPMEYFPPEYVNAMHALMKEKFNPHVLFPLAFKYLALEKLPVDSYSYHSLKSDIIFALRQNWPNSPDGDLELMVHKGLDHIGLIMQTVIVTLRQLGFNPEKMAFHSGSHLNLKFIAFEELSSHERIFGSSAYLP